MNQLIGYCGLDCETCDARKATLADDNELRVKVAKLWSEMNDVQILPDTINCLGCRVDGTKTYYCTELCEIRKCAVSKGVPTCGSCSEFENCTLIRPVLDNVPEARENLK